MVFIKHNSLKSVTVFNPRIHDQFFRIHAFQGPGFLGSRFYRVHFFQDPGFTGSRVFRVRAQVLEVAFFFTEHFFYSFYSFDNPVN